MRNELIKILEEQVMDNLVRAKDGKLFVHINYSNIKSEGRWQLKGGLSIGDNDNENITGDDNLVIETDADEFGADVESQLNTQITMDGTPLLADAKYEFIYDKYYSFANDITKFDVVDLSSSEDKDKKNDDEFVNAVVKRTEGSKVYYVPCSQKEAFYDLLKTTTFVQQPPASPSIKDKIIFINGNRINDRDGAEIQFDIERKELPVNSRLFVRFINAQVEAAVPEELIEFKMIGGSSYYEIKGDTLFKFKLAGVVARQDVSVRFTRYTVTGDSIDLKYKKHGSFSRTFAVGPKPE